MSNESSSSSDLKWYAGGLAFACTQCGNCCTGAPGVVWVTTEEIHAIARARDVSYGEILIHHTRLVGSRRSLKEFANGDCTFLDPQSRRCTIYESRPAQCRTWPFWPRHLENPDSWERLRSTCPGIGCGQLVPLEIIEEQASVIAP